MSGANLATRLLVAALYALGAVLPLGVFAAAPARAQTSIVDVCTGVALPRSAVTDIIRPVITGIASPIENSVNGLLSVLAPRLALNATTLLDDAARGRDITLRVLDVNGNVVDAANSCINQADAFTLSNEAGISIGGNRITGLGSGGAVAIAGELNSIAFGNGSRTAATSADAIALGRTARVLANAGRSVALGADASVGVSNSLALGASSAALRGALANYAATGLSTLQTSVGEVSFGAAGAERQLTNIAAGSDDTDAVNVGQLRGVSTNLQALADLAVTYDDLSASVLTLGGLGGTRITNLTLGQLAAGSTDAVTGGQLFGLGSSLAAEIGGSTAFDPATSTINIGLTYDGVVYSTVQQALDAILAAPGGGTPFLAVNSALGGALAAGVNATAVGPAASAAADNSVALGAASLADRGALAGYAALGLNALQTSAGEVSLGGVGSERQLTHVAAGSELTDAVNVGQLLGVSNDLQVLADIAVAYDDPTAASLTLAGVGGTVISNVSAGDLAAGSTQAVNGAQLFATNTQVSLNTTAITNLGTDLSALSDTAVMYDDLLAGRVTLAGVNGTVLANVAAGALNATSTEAVNGGQLFATNAQVDINTSAITNLTTNLGSLSDTAVMYDDLLAGRVTLAGVNGTVLANVAAGALDATSTEAVNGAQLFATNTQVALNTDAIANIAAVSALAVVYDDPSFDTLTLAGAAGTTISNVAAGELSAASTEAVNGAQLFATNAQVANNTADVVTNTTAITTITNNLNNGAVGVVQYSNAADPTVPNGGVATNDVTLVGALTGPVGLHNVGAGLIATGSTDAVNGGQAFALGQSLATGFGGGSAFNPLTNTLDVAITYQGVQYASIQGFLNALSAAPVGGGSSAYLAVNSNLAPATAQGQDGVAVGPEAQAVADNSIALGAGSLADRTAQTDYVALGVTGLQSSVGSVSFGSAGAERQLTNVAAGTAATDAVNVAQLQGVSNRVDALAGTAVSYDTTTRDTLTLAGANGTTITNVAAGQVNATSTDAVNGSQLHATNTQVALNTTAITNLTNNIANGGLGPVQYSDGDDPETPNGGVRSDDLTLVGASGGAVGLHNVANGRIAAGSTDAVNGGQIYQLAFAATNAVQYDTDANGGRTNSITFQGGDATAPVTLNNVAAGAVTATSTEAINGSQLFQTNQAVATAQTTADNALALGQNSLQYADQGQTRVVLGRSNGPAVTVSNVSAGVADTDAVNVLQLRESMNEAIQQSNTYTDMRLAAVNYNVQEVRKLAFAGTAGALAAAGMPQIAERGKSMFAVGYGAYEGQSAMAMGYSRALGDGSMVFRAGATFDTQNHVGANAGVGWRF
ncbi:MULTISPECIES: YadA-like family protein [unclassified Brevundimonas]|uniref:YadA-like family protein n=1 Tax=unclassified Brevundimonas TaxID=2622653 RepID=UPI0020062121|nr:MULTISPECIES: YadA-like family protein [unclassified Brevundimonas]MCK6104219.1 YadA-like family protein [Brevundimonas sp. EYE_349]